MFLTGCSQEAVDETTVNDGPVPFTEKEIESYVDEHNIEMKSLLNTSDNNYAAILAEHELYQLYKDENGKTASHVREIHGNEDVEFGALNSIVYIIINDKELLERGHMLEVYHEDGAMASELFQYEEGGYSTLYDTDGSVEATVHGAQLTIYNSDKELIYRESMEE